MGNAARIVKSLVSLPLKSRISKKAMFVAKSHYLAIRHHRRYPLEPRWHYVAPSPIDKYDVCSAQIGHRLYVIGGYANLDGVNSFVDVLDMKVRRWTERFDLPSGMAQTHLAVATDGQRFVYAVSGQLGPQCSPAIRDGFVYDALTRCWHSFPPLPEPRYAATMQLWRKRLHVLGGSMPDRSTPSDDHWSIAVHEGQAMETGWRREIPIPRAVQDRPSAVVNEALYIIGGQAGDYVPKPGSPHFECDGRTHEEYFPDVYRLRNLGGPWERLEDMPVAASHMSFPAIVGTSIFTFGGQTFKDPITFELHVTDVIQEFDTVSGRWRIAGHLPYRLKTSAVAHYDGWFYVATGQQGVSATDPRPGRIDRRAWRVRVPHRPF